MKHLVLVLSSVLGLAACGMQHVKVEPVTVQPIHITVDVNLHNDQPEKPQDKPAEPPQDHPKVPSKTARM